MSDRIDELVVLAQNGDADAFGELYELYYQEMYRYALCVAGNDDLALDAVSETALSAFEQIRSLKNARAFKGWIFKILAASCKRLYVKNRRRKALVYLDDESERFEAPPSLDNLEISSELKAALETLSSEEREIVLLSVLDEYKSREIAEIINRPPSTARSKLRRALAKLRKALEDDGSERRDENERKRQKNVESYPPRI